MKRFMCAWPAIAVLTIACSNSSTVTSPSAVKAPPTVTAPSPAPPPVDPAPPTQPPPPPPPSPPTGPTSGFSGELTITSVEGSALGPVVRAGDTSSFALVTSGTPHVEWALCDGPVSWKTPDKWAGTCVHHPPMSGSWEMEIRGREVTLIGTHPLGSRVVIAGTVR